jgi:hypothetical protein
MASLQARGMAVKGIWLVIDSTYAVVSLQVLAAGPQQWLNVVYRVSGGNDDQSLMLEAVPLEGSPMCNNRAGSKSRWALDHVR